MDCTQDIFLGILLLRHIKSMCDLCHTPKPYGVFCASLKGKVLNRNLKVPSMTSQRHLQELSLCMFQIGSTVNYNGIHTHE